MQSAVVVSGRDVQWRATKCGRNVTMFCKGSTSGCVFGFNLGEEKRGLVYFEILAKGCDSGMFFLARIYLGFCCLFFFARFQSSSIKLE